MDIYDELIQYETAVLAKEVGFDENCDLVYGSQKIPQIEEYNETRWRLYDDYYKAPTQSFLQRFLREVCGIKLYLIPSALSSKPNDWVFSIDYYIDGYFHSIYQTDSIFSTYEQALEIGLQESLKLIKNEKSSN